MEKDRPKNRRSLQKRAADLMMEGRSAHEISKMLGVRLDPVLRWQKTKVFQARIGLHKAVMREEMELDMIRAIRETGRYAVENPNGKLGNVTEMLAKMIKISQHIGV